MQPIIIIGMHRSGTSMIANVLKEIGVFIGNDLDNNNESRYFNKLNDWVFYQAGATWDNPYNFQFITDGFKENVNNALLKHLSSLKSRGYMGMGKKILKYKSLQNLDFHWGWKDPLNTFATEMWQDIFPEAKIIHVYRNPIDVAISLQNREKNHLKVYGSKTRTGLKKYFNELTLSKRRIYNLSLRILELSEGIKLWEQYVEKALSYSRDRHNIFSICYEDFLKEPEKQLKLLSDFIEIDVTTDKVTQIAHSINYVRRFAFVTNPDYCKIYDRIKTMPLIKQLGYDTIVN